MDKSNIWGPHFWYVLHTMAFHYPTTPNKVTKKKYYDTIMNFPLFLPHPKMGNTFSNLLDNYPVTPYLDSQESFIKWTHFIHNQVNELLDKPIMSFSQFIEMYTKPTDVIKPHGFTTHHKNAVLVGTLLIIIALIYRLS